MKNIKFFALAAALFAAPIFLTNCGDGETVAPKPVLEFIAGDYVSGDVDLPVNTEFTVGLNASHESNIETLTITVAYDGGAELVPSGCTLCDTTFGSKTFRVDFTGTTRSSTGTEKWTFTIADKDGNSTSKSITVNVVEAGNALFEYELDNNSDPFRVFNFYGPNTGAYQIGGGSLTSSDADEFKDIQDSTTVNEIASWPGRWGSRNGSTFKKVTGYNWGTMTSTSQLQSAWDGAGAEQATIIPAKGEFFVIKTGTGALAFIEITDRVSTSNDNLDYIQFRYKYRD